LVGRRAEGGSAVEDHGFKAGAGLSRRRVTVVG
jgi:hypothetical protein